MKFVKFVGCLSVVGVAFGDVGASMEAVLGPEVPTNVGKGPLVTGGDSYNPALHKPKIEAVFKPLMVDFVRPSSTAPLCDDVIAALMNNEGTADAHISLTVVQGLLDGSAMDIAADHVQADKNMEVQLTQLASQMIREGASDGQGDLVHHMGDVIRCISDEASQRTILQQMVFKGMEKALKTPFAAQLFRGSSDYDPSVALDRFGNNLLSLAVMSGSVNMPNTLAHIEQDKNKEDPSRKNNFVYWFLSSLNHKNDDGFTPLGLCKSTTIADQLKRTFRSFALYFRIQARKHGLKDVEQVLDETMNMLKTSGTIAQEEMARMAPAPKSQPPVGSQSAFASPMNSQQSAMGSNMGSMVAAAA